jgi:hypothetical protein
MSVHSRHHAGLPVWARHDAGELGAELLASEVYSMHLTVPSKCSYCQPKPLPQLAYGSAGGLLEAFPQIPAYVDKIWRAKACLLGRTGCSFNAARSNS